MPLAAAKMAEIAPLFGGRRCARALLADRPDTRPRWATTSGLLLAQKAQPERALDHLDLAISAVTRDMGYLASCVKARRGALAGGDAGRELLQASRQRLVEQGIVNVERCLDMSAPGFRGAGR